MKLLDELKVSAEDRANILGNNAARLFELWPLHQRRETPHDR